MAFDISLSGVNLGLRRLDVTAHNIANASTPGFTEFRTEAATQGNGQGVQVAAVTRPQPPVSPDAPAEVDLAGQMVEMIGAQRSVEANVAMIATENRMQETLQTALGDRHST